jgi:hypothetical protein
MVPVPLIVVFIGNTTPGATVNVPLSTVDEPVSLAFGTGNT